MIEMPNVLEINGGFFIRFSVDGEKQARFLKFRERVVGTSLQMRVCDVV